MEHRIATTWTCAVCEVGGQDTTDDVGEGPSCWNCGGPVTVTARPAVPAGRGPDAR